jgi:hypothetical protein
MKTISEPFSKPEGTLPHFFLVLLSYSLLYLLFFSPTLLSGWMIGAGDSVAFHMPYFYAQKVWWDNLLGSGFPMMADPQVMTWYPPALFFSFLPGGWNLFIISAYVMASCFAYGYVLTLTESRLAAATAGIVYGMSGFMVAQLGHAAILHCAVWLPLLVWSLEGLRRSGSAWWFAAGCLAVAFSNLAGHSQIFVYSLMLAGAYAVIFGWTAPAGRVSFFLRSALMVLIGTGLAAIQIVPTLELGRLSSRANLSFEDFISYSLPLKQTSMMIFPALFGGLPAYGTPVYFGEWNLVELAGYIGLLPLMLAIVGVLASRQRSLSIFWLAAGLLAFSLALGGATPLSQLTYRLPVVNLFRAQARHFFLVAFAVSVLSGFGVKAVLEGRVPRKLVLSTILIFAVVITACLGWLHLTSASAYAAQKGVAGLSLIPWRNRAVGVPLLVFLMAAFALLFWHGRPLSYLSPALLLAVVVLDLGSFGWIYNRADASPREALSPPPNAARYRDALQSQHQRVLPVNGVLSPPVALPPNLSRMWGVPNASIYGPLLLMRTGEMLSMSAAGNLGPEWQKGRDQSLNLMAVRYAFTPKLRLTEELQGFTWFQEDTEISLGTGCNTPNPSAAKIELPVSHKATKIGIVSLLGCSTQLANEAEIMRVSFTDVNNRTQTLTMRAGVDTSEWAHDCGDVLPQIKHGRAPVFKSFPVDRGGAKCEGHDYLSVLPLKEPADIKRIELEWTGASGSISIRKVSLLDEAEGRSTPVRTATGSISDPDRWRHVEEIEGVSVYENLKAMPRAWLVPEVLTVKAEDALRIIKTSRLPDGRAFEPSLLALVEEPLAFKQSAEGARGTAQVVSLSGHHIEVRTDSPAPAFLVLSDIYYPGWRAKLDGQPVHLYQTDFALRGALVPAGTHVLRFEFRPTNFYKGASASVLSLLVLAVLVFRFRRQA